MREEHILNQEEERDPLTEGQEISANMATLGLVNGMIGSGVLVLPVVGIEAGIFTTVWVTLIIGYMAYYTADLLVLHLGRGRNYREVIQAHFNYDYKYVVGYSFCIWLSFVPFMVGYFRLIVLQVEGLMGYESHWVSPLSCIFLLIAVVVLRSLHIWQQFLAYGILSIIIYVIFLTWAQVTAPDGPKSVPANGDPFILASLMIGAFQLHNFLGQNILKNPRRYQYHDIVKNTFLISSLTYIYIILGSLAIVNRTSHVRHPQIINQYFGHGNWQIAVIQVLYLIHLVSAFPNFLIVSNIRFFQMFRLQIKKSLGGRQMGYIIAMLLICFGVYESGVDLITIFAFNGAVIAYLNVLVIPIWLHLKCIWYNKSGGRIEGDQEWNRQIKPNICRCDRTYKSKTTLLIQTIFLGIVVLTGLIIMWYTLHQLINQKPQ